MEEIKRLLVEFVTAEEARIAWEASHLDAALDAWNEFYETHGAFAGEHSTL
jgi:hypothetical protein